MPVWRLSSQSGPREGRIQSLGSLWMTNVAMPHIIKGGAQKTINVFLKSEEKSTKKGISALNAMARQVIICNGKRIKNPLFSKVYRYVQYRPPRSEEYTSVLHC